MKYNPYSHFYLYAKGWYKESDDIFDDLKHIVASYTGFKSEHISNSDVFHFLSKLAKNHILKGHYDFHDFVAKLNPNHFEERFRKQSDKNYKWDYYTTLARSYLSVLSLLNKDQIEGKLKTPDESVLSFVKENTLERWKEITKGESNE